MRTSLRRFALAAPIAAAGMILGLTLPSGGQAGSLDGALPRPERELAEAQRIATFALRLPAWLPAAAALERVSWPDLLPDEQRSWTAFDVWYRLADGSRLHVWQTDDSALEKDPAGTGELLTIGGATWWRERADLGTVLTSRRSDGVTIQISGVADDETLERIAQSFGT